MKIPNLIGRCNIHRTSLSPSYADETWSWCNLNSNLYVYRFFQEHPEYIKYFPFSDEPPEKFPEIKKFQAHATNIMYALHAMVDNLDNTDLLVGLLVKNGESHGRRNIPEKSYWVRRRNTFNQNTFKGS